MIKLIYKTTLCAMAVVMLCLTNSIAQKPEDAGKTSVAVSYRESQSVQVSNGMIDHEVDFTKIDFITFNCECIQARANNSKAQEQIKRSSDILNNNADEYKKLVAQDIRYEKCKGKFKAVLACYIKYYPEITDNAQKIPSIINWIECYRE